jgi:hypothetical protein
VCRLIDRSASELDGGSYASYRKDEVVFVIDRLGEAGVFGIVVESIRWDLHQLLWVDEIASRTSGIYG